MMVNYDHHQQSWALSINGGNGCLILLTYGDLQRWDLAQPPDAMLRSRAGVELHELTAPCHSQWSVSVRWLTWLIDLIDDQVDDSLVRSKFMLFALFATLWVLPEETSENEGEKTTDKREKQTWSLIWYRKNCSFRKMLISKKVRQTTKKSYM